MSFVQNSITHSQILAKFLHCFLKNTAILTKVAFHGSETTCWKVLLTLIRTKYTCRTAVEFL